MVSIKIYTDGACVPNPGECGCGVVIIDTNDKILSVMSEYIGIGTNNIAELTGILRGLTRAKELGITDITIYTDSKICINQLHKKTTKVIHLQPILAKCVELMDGLNIQIEFVKGHNGDKWNEFADKLANLSIDFINIDKQPSSSPIDNILYLNCPFSQKEEVKKLGAQWNAIEKKWTVKDTEENRKIFLEWL